MSEDLLREFATEIGTTLEAAWPHYVRYIWADSLSGVLVGLLIGLFAAWIFRRKVDPDNESGVELRAAKWISFAVVGLTAALIVGSSLPGVIAPEGAALANIVGGSK